MKGDFREKGDIGLGEKGEKGQKGDQGSPGSDGTSVKGDFR